MKRILLLEAPILSRSGYGDRSRDLLDSFRNKEDEWDIYIISLGWGNLPDTDGDEWIKSKIMSDKYRLNMMADLFIKVGLPDEMSRKGKYNVLFTAGIETDTYPIEWVNGLNLADKVVFSSEFVRNVFLQEKTGKDQQGREQKYSLSKDKTEVLFEGYDETIFNGVYSMTDKVVSLFENIKEKQNFLFVGHWTQGALAHDRKDIGGLIHVFLNTFYGFDASKRPGLILKTGNLTSIGDLQSIIEKVQSIKHSVLNQRGNNSDNLPNVYVVYENLNKVEMNDLLNHPSVVAHISFTKGEGFGRPLLEATTSGKPLITTLNSGQDDFLKRENVIEIPTVLGVVHQSSVNKWIVQGSKWNHVDYQRILNDMVLLKFVKEKYLYNKMADEARKYSVNNFTKTKMQSELLNMVDSWIPKPFSLDEIELPDLEEL